MVLSIHFVRCLVLFFDEKSLHAAEEAEEKGEREDLYSFLHNM